MNKINHFKILDLPTFKDSRGILTVLENALPFIPVRTYWIYESDNQLRGGHRHTYTQQALIVIAGSIDIYMNDGIQNEIITLSNPRQCLLVEPKDWHTMKFTTGAILLVMSSHAYDRSEYIDNPYGVIEND
jgi:dTDP-4-dehydrorhamnose 3,5-epimerase-like enzyme